MAVVALSPLYVDIERIPDADLAKKKAELAESDAIKGKPAEIQERIVDGQLRKWYEEVVLYEQPFRDEDRAVKDLITDAISRIGENIRVRRFTRYALGEEL
jgi:elongation factor Ts